MVESNPNCKPGNGLRPSFAHRVSIVFIRADYNRFMNSIYLDHNATTPTRPEVIEAMARCYAAGYANPASQHQPGQVARRVLEHARQRVAEILGADVNCLKPDRVIFTSGGTEANNLALLGMAEAQCPKGRIIVSAVEHASVLETAEHLMERGWRLDTLPVDRHGVVQVDSLESLLHNGHDGPSVCFVSVMLANHETGVRQPIKQLAAICAAAGVPLHTDAVAAAGKIPIHFRGLGVTALSVAAHKFQGPPGIGALLVRHDALVAAAFRRPPARGQATGHGVDCLGRRHANRLGAMGS